MRLSLRQHAAMQGAFLEESVIEQVAKLEVAIRALKIPDIQPVLDRIAALEKAVAATPKVDLAPVMAGLHLVNDTVAAIEMPEVPPTPEMPSLEPILTRIGKVETAITASAKRPQYTFDIERNTSGLIVKVTARPMTRTS